MPRPRAVRRILAARRRCDAGYTMDQVLIGLAILVLVVGMGVLAALRILTGAQEDTAAIEFEQTVSAAQQLLGESSLRGSEYYEAVQTFVASCTGGFESSGATASGKCTVTSGTVPDGDLTEAVAALLNDAFEGGREVKAAPAAAEELGPNEVAIDVQEVDYTAENQYSTDGGTHTDFNNPSGLSDGFNRETAAGINDRGPGDAIRLFMQATDDTHLCAIISQRKGGQIVNGVWYAAYQGIASYNVIRPSAPNPGTGAAVAAAQTMCEWGAFPETLNLPALTEALFNESGWHRDAVTAMANPIGPDVDDRGIAPGTNCTNGSGDSGDDNESAVGGTSYLPDACGAWVPYS